MAMPGTDLETTGDRAPTELEVAGVVALADASLSPATRRVYASAWRTFEAWCGDVSRSALPATPATLALYLAELVRRGRSVSTVSTALASIGSKHAQAGLPDPTTDRAIRDIVKGARRTIGVAPRHQAHPLSVDELRRILAAIDRDGSLRGKRDSALLLLAFGAALRRSELAALNVGDLSFAGGKGVVVTVRRAKADQEGKGALVAVQRGQDPATDVVAALRTWMAAATIATTPDAPLFQPIAWSDRRVALRRGAGGVPAMAHLTGEAVSSIMAARADAAGLGDLGVTGHSTRAGFVTAAGGRGVPIEQIALVTRHRRMETVGIYLRPQSAMTAAPDLGL